MMHESVEALLLEASARAPGEELNLSIRDFISHWGALRRGSWVVEQITEALAEHGLVTVPSFENGWIDNTITLLRLRSTKKEGEVAPTVLDLASSADHPGAWRFRDLRSAQAGVQSVPRDATVQRAQSVMIADDFSQLAVLNGPRNLVGAVSWESIARARMHDPAAGLREAVVPCVPVDLDDEVLPRVPEIIQRGFLFVHQADRTICGIVTTTDISAEFQELAGPFLLMGEVERQLRRIISRTFDLDQLQAARHPGDNARQVRSVADLTVGEYVRLLDNDGNWAMLGWDADRRVFVESLNCYRDLRNEVMHFSPDALDSVQLTRVRNLLAWLRIAHPEGARAG